ncbi:MAG: Na+:solute symporter [Phycisphaerae bacterium]|nr:Na+:solute symporter [Phycisphaerae bacterium]
MPQSASQLHVIDWIVIFAFLAMSLAVGLVMSRRGRRSVREYFTSGGSTPWWLLGTSMVATTFAADTPLTLSGWVVTKGIAQNWFWWCQIPVVMLGVFFIARLWRRAALVTDTELVYLRFSGPSASVLRGFKALYLSLVTGCIVMGWVNLAMTRIVQLAIPDIPRVPVVDRAMLRVYLATPLSNGLPDGPRDSMRGKGLDPLDVYYDDWSFYRNPQRGPVMNELGDVFRRVEYYREQTRTGHTDAPEIAELRTYVEDLQAAPWLERLGLAEDHVASVAASAYRTDGSSSSLHMLETICAVNQAVSDVNELKIILLLFVVVMGYTVLSGLWGVLVTDFIQFWIAMIGCILLAWLAVRQVGGMDVLFQRMGELYGPEKARGMVSLIPVEGSGDLDLIPWSKFLVFIFFAWWTAGLTDGGSYLAQRMLAAKDERHAALGYLWYAIAHFCLRMWPWVIVGFAAAVLFPYTKDALTGQYPGEEIAETGFIRVMLVVLPTGLLGVLLATFLAAYMSTISTQLNLGASYLLNDFYRPFVRKSASERHYVVVSQLATLFMAAIGLIVSLFLTTITDAWFLIGTLGAGSGLVYLLRWFWWRVNAWTEIACLGSLLVCVALVKGFPGTFGSLLPAYPLDLLILVPYSVGIALIATYLTKPVDRERLIEFYRRVQPGGPGWRMVDAWVRQADPTFVCKTPLTRANLHRGLLACAAVCSFLFGISKLIVGDAFTPSPWVPGRWVGAILIVVSIVFGWLVARSLSAHNWDRTKPAA